MAFTSHIVHLQNMLAMEVPNIDYKICSIVYLLHCTIVYMCMLVVNQFGTYIVCYDVSRLTEETSHVDTVYVYMATIMSLI